VEVVEPQLRRFRGIALDNVLLSCNRDFLSWNQILQSKIEAEVNEKEEKKR